MRAVPLEASDGGPGTAQGRFGLSHFNRFVGESDALTIDLGGYINERRAWVRDSRLWRWGLAGVFGAVATAFCWEALQLRSESWIASAAILGVGALCGAIAAMFLLLGISPEALRYPRTVSLGRDGILVEYLRGPDHMISWKSAEGAIFVFDMREARRGRRSGAPLLALYAKAIGSPIPLSEAQAAAIGQLVESYGAAFRPRKHGDWRRLPLGITMNLPLGTSVAELVRVAVKQGIRGRGEDGHPP